jgi:DNA-binding beta-propeller fold protein YncE
MNSKLQKTGPLLAAALLAACATSPRATPEPQAVAGAGIAARADLAPAPARDSLVFVAAEATDEVSLIRFGPGGGRVERKHVTGLNRADPDGPHGVAVAPDGRHYYVTTGHGMPNGHLWKYTTVGDTLKGRVELGLFPASLQVSPDGHYAYVVNFNLHGEMVPSQVSIVSTAEMLEIARLTTCVMPHGSRLNPQGTKHYSACMMDDHLVEIDARQMEVARHFMLRRGREHGMAGKPGSHGMGGHGGAGGHGAAAGGAAAGAAGDAHAGHDMQPAAADPDRCSPTWAATSSDGARVYVACNASNDIVEIDVEKWSLLRRIPAGSGVYNLAATHDGRLLVATNKRGQSVSIFDIASGRELARIPTIRPVVHGVAISDDSRYAFISVEGYGAEPGTVEMIDLNALRRVASVDVGQMAGGIDFWRSEAPQPVR